MGGAPRRPACLVSIILLDQNWVLCQMRPLPRLGKKARAPPRDSDAGPSGSRRLSGPCCPHTRPRIAIAAMNASFEKEWGVG